MAAVVAAPEGATLPERVGPVVRRAVALRLPWAKGCVAPLLVGAALAAAADERADNEPHLEVDPKPRVVVLAESSQDGGERGVPRPALQEAARAAVGVAGVAARGAGGQGVGR